MKRKSWLSIILMTALLCAWAIGGLAQEGVLTLPENLTKIEDEAFAGNTSLGEVVLPEGIETIGSRAFADSTVSVINLPASITSIADDAFDGCGAMEVSAQEGSYAYDWAVNHGFIALPCEFMYVLNGGKVTITGYTGEDQEVIVPDTIAGYPVSCIGAEAFNNVDVTSIVLPRFLETIDYGAFMASGITSIIIPSNVKSIGSDAFYMCSALQQIEVSQDNDTYASIDGVLFEKSSGRLVLYPMGKAETEYVIPENTVEICDYAFYGNEYLKYVEMAGGVERVGIGAFAWCMELQDIALPESITYIGANAFYKCVLLKSISIPDGVEAINDHVFYSCYALNNVSLGNGIAEIGEYAFYDCDALTELILPENLESIKYYAFGNCNYMESIKIPASVTVIEEKVFEDCDGGLIIYGEEGSCAQTYAADHEIKFVVGDIPEENGIPQINNFYINGSDTEVRILDGDILDIWGEISAPEGATISAVQVSVYDASAVPLGSVGETYYHATGMSVDCFDLDSIPDMVIGDAFGDSDYVMTVDNSYVVMIYATDSNGNGLEDLDPGTVGYQGPSVLVKVIELSGETDDGYRYSIMNGECEIDEYLGEETNLIIPEEIEGYPVTRINNYAFWESSVQSVELPNTLTSIGYASFYGCEMLTEISIPESVKAIEDYAFNSCINLMNVSLPSDLQSIGIYAFYGCENLESISIPESVVSIGEGVFEACFKLRNVILPEEMSYVGAGAFAQCGSLEKVTLPRGINEIGDYMFYECESLTAVEIPEGVERIGKGAFYYCTSIKEFVLPSSLKNIEEWAFQSCTSIENIYIPSSLVRISDGAFYQCGSLKQIVLPAGITSIPYSTFAECGELRKIEIPASVTHIGDMAFYWCNTDALTIYGTAGSYAETYAAQNNIAFYAGSIPVIDSSYKTIDWNGHAYQLIDESMTWTEAKAYCESQGGHLVTITSEQEQTAIQSLLANYGDKNLYWIGLYEEGDNAKWITGEVFEYSNWASGEPNSANEMYGEIYRVGSVHGEAFTWNDATNDAGGSSYGSSDFWSIVNHGLICEFENTVQLPTFTDFTLNATPLEITVPMGSQLVFGGTISAGSAPLVDVQASVFLASDHEQGAVYEREEDIKADTYDLSRLSPMTVGAEYNGFAMTAGNSYDVMLYVTDGNGRGFESDPYIRVNVVEAGEITWYAEITDEAGNVLSSVTLPHTGEYAGKICVRTNNGDMTAWVDEGFPFDFALESVEPQDDGAYVFTYALSAPLILFDEVCTDTVLFCLRDENSTAITDTPLAQLTITQEGNPTPPEIFSITDREGNDLTTTPLKLDYTGACATDVIVHGNYAAITAWFNTVTTIDFGAPVETVLEDGTVQLVFSNVTAGENMTASEIARTCVFYAYTTDASNPDKSRTLGEIQVVQEGDPRIPTAVTLVETLADGTTVTYDRNNPVYLYVGDHNYLNGWELNISAGDPSLATYKIYSDNEQSVFPYRDEEGKVYIQAFKDQDANIYISHVEADSLDEVPEEYRYFVCKVDMPTYRALLIGQDYKNNQANIGELPCCANDIAGMKRMLESMGSTSYTVASRSNLTEVEMINAISSSLGAANEHDVSLFYYSGHGMSSSNSAELGALVDMNGEGFTVSELKAELDKIKGRKIVILSSCHSGYFIGKSVDYSQSSAEQFNENVVMVFSARTRANNLAEDGYYVITAAHSTESAYTGNPYSVFTAQVLKGSGLDVSGGIMAADISNDQMIGLYECYQYAHDEALKVTTLQRAQVYPENSNFTLWAK